MTMLQNNKYNGTCHTLLLLPEPRSAQMPRQLSQNSAGPTFQSRPPADTRKVWQQMRR
jgi:hypothetical protein